MRAVKSLFGSIWRLSRFFLIVLFAYLLQVCVMPYFAIGGITPSLMIAVASIITVCYGKLRTFWAGGIFGILTETMSPTVSALNLLSYPLICTFSSAFFADKSEKRLEAERSMNKRGRNIHPYIRTPFCAMLSSLMFSAVNTIYIYLGGSQLLLVHYTRAILFVILTTLLSLIIMLPVRKLLGFSAPPKEEKAMRGRYISEM